MPKAYILDTGLRNCLINNFENPDTRLAKGELWENTFFRSLADKHVIDAIKFWRTTEGNEVDFVLPNITTPFAVETKYNEALIKQRKYNKFKEAYPAIILHFAWMYRFDENFLGELKRHIFYFRGRCPHRTLHALEYFLLVCKQSKIIHTLFLLPWSVSSPNTACTRILLANV